MTTLTIYEDKNPDNVVVSTTDPNEIKSLLDKVGVAFERWKAGAELPQNATQEQVIAAYKTEVDRLSPSSSTSTPMTRTRSASSSRVRAPSTCISATRSIRWSARATTCSRCRPARSTGSTWARSRASPASACS